MSTSVSFQGRELIAAWRRADRSVAEFVLALADFDRSGEWAEDGFACCASWLVERCEMARATAHEKLKVAHELERRDAVRAAFVGGMPYSKVRLLVRLNGVDPERDDEFVAHARTDTIRVLEERVNNWNYYNCQDDKPSNLDDHYGIRRQRGVCGGMGKVVIEAPDDMLDRVFALLDAYGRFLHYNEKPDRLGLTPVDESAMQTPTPSLRAVDESAMQTPAWSDEADDEYAIQTPPPDGVASLQTRGFGEEEGPQPHAGRSLSARRLDWLLDLLEEIALADPKRLDPYVAALGVTIQYEDLIEKSGNGLSDQGSTLTGEAVRRLACDCGIRRIIVKGQSEILDYGREERLFNRALRRAIRFRHGHVCAVRGCGRRITHIHHVEHFENGGETTIHNGIPLCSYHHHLVHEGKWEIAWNPTTGVVKLEGPRGQVLQTTASFLRAA